MDTHDYLKAQATIKDNQYKADYAAVGTALAVAIVSVAGQIHPEFLRLPWALADKQTRNYYALISAEEEIGSEASTWSRARTFSFNKNFIGKAIAYATATRLHLSMHSTTSPSRRQPDQHMHRIVPPLALHPLALLSTWMRVHPSSRHLLMLIVQVPLAR